MVEMESRGVSEQLGWRKGPWTPEEDKILVEYVGKNGEGRWSCVSKCAGLNRSGKSCRLRWVNYLRPGLKKGHLTPQEEGIILELHALWGNKWSTIARYLPGRTDNEIKNYWRTHFKKRKPSGQKDKRKTHVHRQGKDENILEGEVARNEDGDMECHNMEMLPMIQQDCTGYWSDFVPVENYLWGGLWNLDDHSNCSKMASQNQVNRVANCSRGGGGGGGDHAVNYMHSGGYIF